jgi:hypothetical protein
MSDFGSAPPPAPEGPQGQGRPPTPEGMPPTAGGMPPTAGGMPPMPGGMPSGPGEAPVPPARPAAITQAVMLMRVGAVLSVVSGFLALFMRDSIRDLINEQVSKQGTSLSAGDVDLLINVALVSAVVTGLLGAALWIWMAWANGRGAPWARIVATVLFAFSLLSALGSLVQTTPSASRLLSLAEVLLGAYIIALLYRRESSEFYRARSLQRY